MVIPTFHPAAILRGGGDASRAMQQIRQDFAAIREALDQARAAGDVPVLEEQLGLF
jgi:uracil-DNA glycosylase